MELNYGFDGSSSFEELEPAAPVPYDFTSPTGIVGADKWRNASVEERVKAAPRAFVKLTEALEQDKTRTVKGMNAAGEEVDKPLFDASGNYTTEGRDYLDRSRNFLEVAARHETGGTEFDPIEGKLVEAEGLSGFMTKKREKQPDPFKDYDKVREQVQAVDIEGKTPEMSFDAYVDHHNEGLAENSPARMDKDNERMRSAFDQRKQMEEFDPAKMDQNAYVWDVAGRKIPNLKKLNDMPGLLAAIDEQDISAADKKMMKINLRDSVNKMDSQFITEAADAEAFAFDAMKGGVLAPVMNYVGGELKDLVGMDRQDIHSKFTRHMDAPGGDMYSFIEQNPDLFAKDQYGMLDKLNNAFWAANRSTGAGAMLLAAAPFGGNDSITQYAADSSRVGDNAFEGMGGTEHYKVLGMDFTNKGIYDMAGQVASMMTTFGSGGLVKGGIKGLTMAGAARGVAVAGAKSVGMVAGGTAGGYIGSELGEAVGGETGEMVGGIAGGLIGGGLGLKGVGALQGTGAATAMGRQITLSEKAMKQAMTDLAPNTLKNFGIKAIKDPSAYIGALQAGGMSFGSTYNQVFDKTGNAEEAYHQAGMKGLADGASAFIATAVFNRIAPGLEKGMSGVEGGWSGSIFKHLKMNKALKSAVSQDAQKAAIETLEGLAAEGSELRKALAPALRETINRAARANGLKGYGPLVGMGAEFMEETFDTALSDVFLAVLDRSKTWKGEVWDNIGDKFSEYMAAGVMGAFGGGLGESGGMVVETAGAFRKKNRDTRVREIKEFAEVIWKDIEENNSDASAEMLGIKAASGAPVVSVANYMADESIPVEKRAKVLAQHAVSGFARRLEPSATTPVERAQKAQEKAKNAPPDPKVVRAQEMSDHLGPAPKDKDGNDMEWNPELREPTRDLTHNFTVGGDSFTMKSVAVKGETAVGAVLTDSKGVPKNLSPSEAAEQLKAADKIPFLKARKKGSDSATRQSMIKSFGNFDSSQTTNYAQPIQSRTDSGAGPKVTPPVKKSVGDPTSAERVVDSEASGPSKVVPPSGPEPVAPVVSAVKQAELDVEGMEEGELAVHATTAVSGSPNHHRGAAVARLKKEGKWDDANNKPLFAPGQKVSYVRSSGEVVEGTFSGYDTEAGKAVIDVGGKPVNGAAVAKIRAIADFSPAKEAPSATPAKEARNNESQVKLFDRNESFESALERTKDLKEGDEVAVLIDGKAQIVKAVIVKTPKNGENGEYKETQISVKTGNTTKIDGKDVEVVSVIPRWAVRKILKDSKPVESALPSTEGAAGDLSPAAPVAVREVLGRKPHQKLSRVDAALEELWDDGVAVVVGEDEAEAREEHGIPESQRVLMIPASEIGNDASVRNAVREFKNKPTNLIDPASAPEVSADPVEVAAEPEITETVVEAEVLDVVEEALTPEELQTAAEIFAEEDGFNPDDEFSSPVQWDGKVAKRFGERFADWMATGKEASAKLEAMFKKVWKAMKAASIAGVAFMSFQSGVTTSHQQVQITIPNPSSLSPDLMELADPASQASINLPADSAADEAVSGGAPLASRSLDDPSIGTTPEVKLPAPPVVEVPAAASSMSPVGKLAYQQLYAALKDELQRTNKLLVITDKPTAHVFVFNPDGSLLLKSKVLLGLKVGDYFKGNTDIKSNRITPAGLFNLGLRDASRGGGEARTAHGYDFGKVFVLDKAIDGEFSVTLFHSVWLNESDASQRQAALKDEGAADSRYSFGCINLPKAVYKQLLDKHQSQMDGAKLFVVPDNTAALDEFLSGDTAQNKSGKDDLTRQSIPASDANAVAANERRGRQRRRGKKETKLNAQPDTANDKPSEEDPLFRDPSAPQFYVNPVFDVEDEFGGVWSKDDKSQIYYKPAKGKTLPIGVNAVVEIEGDDSHVLVLTEEADGNYYFRQIDVRVIGEAMRGKDSVALGKLNTAWNRNRLTKAGEAIEPLLKELLAGKGTVDPAAFRKMLEDVLKVVAPGTNPAAITWDAKMEKGFFFNVKRDGDRLSMDLDKDAFVANLRSIFRSYDPARGKLYDSFVANEVARQIAAFVDEEQTHFVAMREFSDAEIIGAFDSFSSLSEDLDKDGKVVQAFVNDVFQRVAAQRVKGRKIEDFDDSDKYLVASETLRALNQILTGGVSTEQQTTDSKRLLIALNEDFSNKDTTNPWKTVVELLKRYMQKIKRMAHLRYMVGQLPPNLNRMIRQQETAYVAANLRGDVDQIKEKGLEEAVERFQRSREMTKKAIGAVAMKNNEVLVEIREIAGKLGMSLDDMIVLDYKAGTIRLRTFDDKDGVDVRGLIGRYYPGTDLDDLDKALGELNEEGALSLVQRDLGYAWQQLEWARANSPNFLSVLEDGSEPDKLKVWSQLVASAPLMDNGSRFIQQKEAELAAMANSDRITLHNANVDMLQALEKLDLRKVKDVITANKVAKELGYGITISEDTSDNIPAQLRITEKRQMLTVESVKAGWRMVEGKWVKTGNQFLKPNQGPPMFDEVVVETQPASEERQSLSKEEWLRGLRRHAADMAMDDDSLLEGKSLLLGSNALLPVQSILLSGQPVNLKNDKRLKLQEDLAAFKLAVMTEEQQERIGRANLTEEEQASLAKLNTAKEIEMYASGESRSDSLQALLKARRLRAEAAINKPFAEDEMAKFNGYMQALDQYNQTNRRVVDLVLGDEKLDTGNFGMRFQSLAYAKFTAFNTEEMEAYVKAKLDGRPLFFDPEQGLDDITPTSDKESAYGYNYYSAAFQVANDSENGMLFYHVDRPGVPFIPEMVRSADGMSMVEKPYDKSKVFTLKHNVVTKDVLLNRHVASNMAAVGTNYQMQWQKLLTEIGVNEELAQRYEGSFGFNTPPIDNDEFNATTYEGLDAILPNIQYGKYFIDFLNGVKGFTSMKRDSFFTISGIPEKIAHKSGETARMNQAVISSTDEYKEETLANYFQKLRNWATKLQESTDPKKILGDINGMQTLAGRLSSRIHERATEALQLINEQEGYFLKLHFDVVSSGLSGKELAEQVRAIFNNNNHKHLNASVLSLRTEARWARAAVRRFVRSRPNVTREVTQTSRDAGMVAYSDFFESARKGHIDYPTMQMVLWNINYFSKSKTSAVSATFGMDLYEKFRRISFSKEDGELVVGGQNWVWSDVPVFERDAKGEVVFEEMFEKRGVGKNGEEFTELVSASHPDYQAGMPVATTYRTESVNGVAVRRSVPARQPKVRRDANGDVLTARKQIHVDMDPSEAIAYAIADKDNSGHFPLASQMGTQGSTVQETREGRATEDSSRSRAQRAQVTTDLQRQLQNKRLTEAALLVGLNLDGGLLPANESPADAPRQFLRDLVALENDPSGYDAFIKKAIRGLFGATKDTELAPLVKMYHDYASSRGVEEIQQEESYEAEEAIPKETLPIKPVQGSFDMFGDAIHEEAMAKWEKETARINAQNAPGAPTTRTVTKTRTVTRMGVVPSSTRKSVSTEINPFELMESLIEFKAKSEMELIDQARVVEANGNGNDANKELLLALRTAVGYALSTTSDKETAQGAVFAKDSEEIKASFSATASKMAELGMGDLFAPRKGNGFASSEEARKIALMMQAESRGDKAINLHRGNVFAQYNETGFVSANRAVNLLTQNIPGVLVYRASKSEIDKNQAYFGSRFLPGVDGNPPVLYAAEGSNSADNEAMVVQALAWWGTQSESAALVAPVLQEAAERIRVALSPITRIERFMRAHKGNETAVSKMLGDWSMSLLEQNPERVAAMDEAAKEAEVEILSGLLRDHFASMETLHALAGESERDRAVDVGRVDLSGLNGEQSFKTDVWLVAQAMTNPNMKKLLDRFLFGDNLLKSSGLSNATLNEILLANKQMGEDAVEEQDPYAFDNALEVKSAPATDEDAELAEEQAADDVERSWLETELEKFMASRVDTTERQEVELDIEPSTEDKELLRSVEPTVASILQYLRNKNHDISEYGVMDERMEAVLEEFHRGRGGFEDPAWNGESLPASDAMMINLFVDLVGLAKEHPAMRFNATKQMEGLASSRPTTGKQLLVESTSPQARPVVRQNTSKGLRRTQESMLPGREGVPVVTAWHNMMDGRINGRTASTLHHESNRFKSFAGGLLNRVSGVESVLRKEAQRSIDQGTQSWVDMGKGMDKFIAYPRAFADMALTPELFAEMKKAFPMLEGHEAEARRELEKMQDRKIFIEKSIAFHQTTVDRIESEMAAVPDLFNAQTITLLDDVQREAVMQHVLAEADAIYRSNLPANLAPNRSGYQKLLNQTIGSISTFGKEAAAKTLIQELNEKFDSLENDPKIRPIRQKNTRALLNEMQLPSSLKAEIAERGKVLGAAEMNKLRLARQNVELASKELAGMVRVAKNPAKGGFVQRLAYGSVTPWAAGRHTFVSGEKGPTGRAESVNATIVLYPAGTTPNFEYKMGIEAGIAQLTAKWNDKPADEKDYEFYIMKEALTKSLAQYARHADELYRAVKGDQAYFNDYNPAAIIRQVSDTLTLQEKIAEARLAEFKSNFGGVTGLGSQLSPDALALLAEPGVHSIYSTSNVKAAMDVRDELAQRQIEAERAQPLLDKLVALQNEKTRLVKLSVNPKFHSGLRGNLEVINNQIKAVEAKLADEKVFTHPIAGNLRKIKSLQADLARLNAARRVSKYKVPANFEARKDIIGHLINNGEWIMLGQINAEQDLRNRFASDNELTPAEKAAKRKGKRITMRDVVLNSLPDTDEPIPVPQSKNRMGFTRQWKDETWSHSFGGARFTPAGTTREQVAKEYATRHAGLLIDRANARPGDKAAGFKLAADKKVDAEHVDMKNALSQLSHMVEALVLGYDKLSPSTESDQRGLKEDVKKFIESLGDDSIRQSDNTAQQVRLFELFERMSARIEGEAALQQLLTGLSTNLSTAELTAMKLLHHHDARVRVRYRKNYLAQLEAMRLHGILQNGFDMNSGRNGWISQLEAEKKVMAKKHLALGNDSLMQSIPYMIASLQGLLNVRTNSVAANFSMWSNDLKKGVKDLSLYKDAQQANRSKATDGVVKQAMGGVKGFFTDEHVNVMRDENMVKELYALIEDIVDSPYVTKGDKEAYAVEQINLAIERLYAKSEEGGVRDAAKEYADYIGAKFKGMTDAAEIMMMAMGHDQKEQEDINPSEAFLAGRLHGQARLISTVPLRYAYATDPAAERLSLEVTPYKSDPLHEVGFQEMSLLGGPGRTEKRDKNKKTLVFRPVSLNGISAIEGMLDDTLYRLNVTPVYSSLRNIVGSVQQAGPNQAEIVNSLILGEDEQNADKRLQRVALAGIASEFDNEIANDMQHGVTDTAFAESIQFLSSMYIFKALASFQQWWNQSAPSLLGYGAKKLLSGKWNEAGMMFEAMGQIVTSKSFDKNEPGDYNHDAKEFMLRVAPWSSFRGADGMDQVKVNLRNQTRHGVGNVKAYSGKAVKMTQHWQEKMLDVTIAKPERLLSRAIFLTELMAELQWMKSRGMIDGEVPGSIAEMIKAENKGRFDIPQEAVEAAQTKLNDHMGVSDKAKKSFFFQNKTSSPTWNALMRSIVRFSNHQASTASNMSAMAPTLWQAERHALTTLNEKGEYVPTVNEAGEYVGGQMTDGGKRAHQNAVENLVGTMVQNSMFHALKIRNLLPILLSVGYMLGGDDEDEAMAKAQEKADELFNSEGEDNAVVGAIKAMTIGKPGQFFQDWKDSDAAAASAYAGLGSSMLSEVLPVVPVAGAVLGLFPVASAFKNGITNSVVQEATAKLLGMESAENKWDKEAVNVWEMESSGIQTAMQLTAPTGVLYDLASGLNLAYDANDTGEVSAFDISLYLAQEILFSTREGRQTSKKVLQEAVWANEP